MFMEEGYKIFLQKQIINLLGFPCLKRANALSIDMKRNKFNY